MIGFICGIWTNLFKEKATLKWSSNVELSSIDMARILELLANKDLTQYVLACDSPKTIFRDTSEILFHFSDD